MAAHQEERAQVGPASLKLLTGGTGRPVLVLHGIEGDEGWLLFHDALAERFRVLAPSHPGFGYTEAPEWITAPRHIAVFYLWYLQETGHGPLDVIGNGALGGWIAACMAVLDPSAVRRLVLVGSGGVKPQLGEIFDVFVATWPDVVRRSFHRTEAAEEYQRLYASANLNEFGGVREAAKVMSMKLCFRPYMYDPSLPGMLPKITAPTLLLHGREDVIVPPECSELYREAIPGAMLRTLDGCGHWAHLEKPRELAGLVREFIGD
ncbi:MAG: alpha/beta hydrolase [Chloroflexi bacterium]|nr:alpha/beta hydrolase [Chloroflexota bacterium]